MLVVFSEIFRVKTAVFIVFLPLGLLLMKKYIYQYDSWPRFTWDSAAIVPLLGKVRNLQGRISGRLDALVFSLDRNIGGWRYYRMACMVSQLPVSCA
jgi:uncharacterized SAM-binding protein YcdF (DUF218 family)